MNWCYEHYASSQGRNKLFLSCSLGLHTARHIFTFKTWRKGKATPIFKYETFTFIRIWSGIWKKHVGNKWFIHVVWIKFFTSFFLVTYVSCSNITWQMDWRLHVQATFILVVNTPYGFQSFMDVGLSFMLTFNRIPKFKYKVLFHEFFGYLYLCD